jgi:hypothetical protein
MHVLAKAAEGGISPRSCQTEASSKASLPVRIWLAVLTSLRESRENEAARLIHRYRHLLQDRNASGFRP